MPSGGPRNARALKEARQKMEQREEFIRRFIAAFVNQTGRSTGRFARELAIYLADDPTAYENYQNQVGKLGSIWDWFEHEGRRCKKKGYSLSPLQQIEAIAQSCPAIVNAPRPRKRKRLFGFL